MATIGLGSAIQRGIASARPASGDALKAGQLWYATDTGVLSHDNGTAWADVAVFDADLVALAGVASAGLLARTGAGTAAARTLTAGAGLAVTNGDGVSGNPTPALDLNGLTADASPDGAADYVATYDASAGTHKKVLLDNLPGGGGVGGGGGSSITSGPDASRPAPGTAGALYLTTDAAVFYEDDGTAWNARKQGSTPYTTPPSSGWSWVNQGSATVAQTNMGIHLRGPAGSGDNIRMRVRTPPATPYTITVAFIPALFAANFASCGLVWRESGSGKVATIGLDFGQNISYTKYNSPTSVNAGYTSAGMIQIPMFVRLADDGTNRSILVTFDGQNFYTLASGARTDFLTPDQVGIYVNPNNGSFDCGLTLLSWLEA